MMRSSTGQLSSLSSTNWMPMPCGSSGRWRLYSRIHRTWPEPSITGDSSASRISNQSSVPGGFGLRLDRNMPPRLMLMANFEMN